jgi:hypothetical protein
MAIYSNAATLLAGPTSLVVGHPAVLYQSCTDEAKANGPSAYTLASRSFFVTVATYALSDIIDATDIDFLLLVHVFLLHRMLHDIIL